INPLQKKFVPDSELEKYIIELEGKMKEAAKNLDFEAAAVLRDEMNSKKDRLRKITLKSQ
ncbi:MAG: UvrB/UvrC motif-containing protein, partial [Bacteroidetes bacterium]|nr:UvrB/UvrC motif-containing protein [Bacteroidota bacterium]